MTILDIAPTFYQNDLAISNTTNKTIGKPIAVWFQSVSSVSAINSLLTFHNIHGIKGEMLFFSSVANLLFPTLIPLSEVGTTCFLSCCDKGSAIIFTTGHLPDVNLPWNWSRCSFSSSVANTRNTFILN
jgi:hypothetical protein